MRAPVADPATLKGGRMGVIRYGMTAAVWARALLQDAYGIAPADLAWWIGEPQFFQPAGIELNVAEGQAALEAMLLGGELDCLFSVHEPRAFREGRLHRLFPDFGAAERAEFQRAGLYPIMHTILVKRALVEAHPALPAALLDAFQRAKQQALDWVGDTDASSLPLPFQHAWVADVRGLLGTDPWPYGIAANRAVLECFAAHMQAQGLTARTVQPEALFLPLEP